MFAGRDKKTESRSIHCSDVFSCADSRLFKIWDVLFRIGLDAKFEMFLLARARAYVSHTGENM